MSSESDPFSLLDVATGDDYTTAATLAQAPVVSGVFVRVLNATVVYQLQVGNVWQPGKPLSPWVGQLAVDDGCTGIRFRSAYSGQPARVSATLQFAGEHQGAPASYGVDSGGSITPVAGGELVSGDIIWSAAATRTGAVLCDGTLYDGTNPTYAALYAAIGTSYGGSGPAAFAVPDLRDRVAVGAGGNTARATTEGVAAANRVNTRHRHTVPGVTTASQASPNFNPSQQLTQRTGGSGVAADPLDGPAFLALNAFIVL